MSESPSLTEIAADHNGMAEYIRYVSRCIDDRRLPLKYPEWLYEREEVQFWSLMLTNNQTKAHE